MDAELIQQFRDQVTARIASAGWSGDPIPHDRPDGSTLATRFPVAENLWIECALRPNIPQIRAGIVTTDRWVSEELEEAIESTGDTMSEFIELGFDEVDLDWSAPIVEHFRDSGTDFYFATSFEPERLSALGEPATVDKAARMLLGYYEAFKEAIEKMNAEAE